MRENELSLFRTYQPVLETLPFFVYHDIKQNDPLCNIVLRYYEIDNELLPACDIPLFPDCCTDIVFYYKKGKLCNVSIGSAYKKLSIKSLSPYSKFGITLFPGAFPLLFNEDTPPPSETGNQVSLTQHQLVVMNTYIKRMQSANTFEERVKASNEFFSKFAGRESCHNLAIVDYLNKGTGMTLQEYSKTAGYSVRQLQRVVFNLTGCTPKYIMTIRQFMDSVNQLLNTPGATIKEIALENEYYDDSHMRRTYQKLSSYSPSELLAVCDKYTQAASIITLDSFDDDVLSFVGKDIEKEFSVFLNTPDR